MSRPFAAGDRVLLVDNKQRRHLITLADGRRSSTPTPAIVEHDDLIGARRRHHRAHARTGARLVAVRPTLVRVRARDAARRAGDLPEGPRPDPHARRHLPGRAHPRVGRRLRRAHAARCSARSARPATSPATRSATTSPTARGATSHGFLGADVPLDVEVRDVYEGIDEHDLDRIVLDLPEPWRVVKHAVAALRPGGILRRVPADDPAGRRGCARSSPTSPFGMVETLEVLQRTLARRGPVDPPRPPDGRAHRLPHPRAAARARRLSRVMNALDVAIIAAVLAAGVGGWRLGFVARAFAWARRRARPRRSASTSCRASSPRSAAPAPTTA